MSRPTVVYVAGSGRSGSTLLERTLGAIPGWVNIGEAIDIPRKVAPLDELCGCGETFSNCPFWTRVGRALEDWDPEWLARTHALQASVARQRRLPQLLAPRRGKDFEGRRAEYRSRYGALYRAAAAEAGADVVVDASKWPSLAMALHGGEIDLRVIHLVRDVRGVAFSLDKSVIRPQSSDGEAMHRNHPTSGAARWLATQTEVDLVRHAGVPVARMRYADFVDDPAASIAAAISQLGMRIPAEGLTHIDGRRVTLGVSHGVSGNPSRFRLGETTLRPDDEWRTRMPIGDKLRTTAIGLPQLLRLNAITPPASSSPLPGSPPRPNLTDWPLVSVVLPTHGRPELVREALTSVVSQTYPGPLECVVVHDAEDPDLTLVGLATPGRSITVLTNAHDPGLAGSRNTGLDGAKGAFIASIDDDDTWHPDKVEKQIRRFHDDPDLLVLGSGIRLLLADGRIDEWPGRAGLITHSMLLRNRVKELHSSTLMMRRDAFAKAGRYDEELPNGYGEDWDIVIRMARVGKIGVVREPLADIRKDGGSYYIGRAERTVKALEAFLEKHPEMAGDRRGHARLLGQLAYQRAVLGDRRGGARLAARAALRWPLSPHPYVAALQSATGMDPVRVQKLARRFGRGMA